MAINRVILSFEMCVGRYAAHYATEDGKTESYEVDALALVESTDETEIVPSWRSLEPCTLTGGSIEVCRDDPLFLGITRLLRDEDTGDLVSTPDDSMVRSAKAGAKKSDPA